MYFKSSKRMKLQFTKDELSYVEKTDNLKKHKNWGPAHTPARGAARPDRPSDRPQF